MCEAGDEDEEDVVGLEDDGSVMVITGSLGSRGLETKGVDVAEGPSNKLLPTPTDVAVAPPTTPEMEGAEGATSDCRLRSGWCGFCIGCN